MMNKSSLLSIVINTFNRKELLLEEIYALLNQTIDKDLYDIIVVDDGSTDGTEKFLSEKGVMNKIRYFRQRNLGRASAKNLGLKNVLTPFIVFLGDDMLPSNKLLEIHLKYQKSFKNIAVLGMCEWKPEKGSESFKKISNPSPYDYIEDKDDAGFLFFHTGNISVETNLVKDVGGFDENFRFFGWEDIELGYRLEKGKNIKVMFVPEAYALHRHPEIDLDSLLKREYESGISVRYFCEKYPDEEFKKINPLLQRPGARPGNVVRKKFGKLMIQIFENTFPSPVLLDYLYKRLLFSYRVQGFFDAEKKINLRKGR